MPATAKHSKPPARAENRLAKHIRKRLRRIAGDNNVKTSDADRRLYSYDAGTLWRHPPDCVVFAESTEQVSAVMALACAENIPVTPRGGGTNQSGGSVPIRGGIVLVVTKMNRILSIDADNHTAVVEPGVVLQRLNAALAECGLYFPPDPQSFFACTIGGMLSENAGGPVCLKYGVTKQYVLGMDVVLTGGRVARWGGLSMNNRNGFDVSGLMVGSEGTLGIITRAVLRLLPLPEARRTVAAAFDDLETAGKSVTNVISAGIIPAKSEIIDNWVIRKSEAVHPAGLPIDAEAVILFETDGTAAAAETEAKTIAEICRSTGATRTTIAKTPAEAERYWTARRAGFAQAFSSAPTLLAEDVCVPIRHVPTLLKQIREISDKHGVITIVLGHMGDGNMHPDILTDADDPKRFARAEAAMTEIIETALSLGGVVSGEHGIGLEKKRFIEQALDPNVIAISRAIRGVFDPTGIMNPGKIWP